MAASDYFLKIDGIKGESTDDKHKEWIEVQSFSWGVSQTNTRAGVGGGGAGKAVFSDLSFSHVMDKSSPMLMLHCASGKHISKAQLTLRKAGGPEGESMEYYKITLSDCLVSSFQQSGGGELPAVQFSLNYTKIEMEYRPQDAEGRLGDPVRATWDIKANKGS